MKEPLFVNRFWINTWTAGDTPQVNPHLLEQQLHKQSTKLYMLISSSAIKAIICYSHYNFTLSNTRLPILKIPRYEKNWLALKQIFRHNFLLINTPPPPHHIQMLSNKTQNNAVYDSFFLDQTFNSPQMQAYSKNEVEWLTNKITLPKTATILDVACGSGRHLKAFVDLGYKPHGLDTSPDCVQQAQANCPQIKDQIFETDFLSYAKKFPNEFDLVFIAGASFGYDSSITVILEHLENLLNLVANNGHLVIQFLNKNWAQKTVKNKISFWTESDDYYTLDKRTLDGDLLKSDKIFIKKNDSFQKKCSDVVYTFTHVELEVHIKELCAKLNRKIFIATLSDSFSDIHFNEEKSTTPVLILKRLP